MSDDSNDPDEYVSPDPISDLKAHLEAVKAVDDPDARDDGLRAAFPPSYEIEEFRAHGVSVPDLRDHLEAGLRAPNEEVPYFINRALKELERGKDRKREVNSDE